MAEFLSQNPVLIALIMWSIPWKAVALWKAAKRNEKWWFGAMLIINTIGILEIIYIFYFSKREIKESSVQEVVKDISEQDQNKEN